jgi:hypothetical protein
VEVLRAYRRLAIRVLELAFRDLDHGSPALKESALEFLTRGQSLMLWCELAEIGPSRVMSQAFQLRAMGNGGPGLADPPPGVHTLAARLKLASARSSVS